jgi:opacity protein-like surface antigen
MRTSKTLIAGIFLLASPLAAMAQYPGQYPGPIEADPSYRQAPAEPGPDSGAYGGLRGSFAFNHSVTTYAPPAATALRASYGNGGGGSVFLGTHLPLNLRLELEGLYRYQDISHVGVNGLTSAASGKSQTGAAMLNLFWDFPVPYDSPIQPFLGMGVGGAYNVADAYDASNTYLRRSKWDLAYSVMAGLSMPLDETSRLTAMYRWMQTRDAGYKCATSGTALSPCLDANVNSSSVDLGYQMDL